MNLLVFILAAWGMTNILVYGKIFDRVRPRYSFFHCPMCVGFHVGYVLFALLRFLDIEALGSVDSAFPCFVSILVAGCISSATSDALIGYFSAPPVDAELLSTEELHDEWDGLQSE